MATFKFRRNPAGIRALLQSDGVGSYIEQLANGRAPSGTTVDRQVGANRVHVRIVDPGSNAVDRNAKTGHLTNAIGGGA